MFLFNTCFANLLSLIASVTHASIRNVGRLKSLTARDIFIGSDMSNNSDLKPENENKLLSNIKLLKIIAIILGILIIVGLFFLFIGLAKSYNNLDKIEKKYSETVIIKDGFDEFTFFQPKDAQLISTSLGTNNEMLLRFLYKGNNVLVVLNIDTNKIRSIITLKRGKDFGK